MEQHSPRSLVLGIDPGAHGGLVFVWPGRHPYPNPRVVAAYAMPTRKVRQHLSKKDVYRVNAVALSEILERHANDTKFATVEEVSARPHDGVSSAFTFGVATGILHGALAQAKIPMHLARPDVWKLLVGATKDKNRSLALATKFFGKEAEEKYWPKKRDEGIAEAALIAFFSFRFIGLRKKPEIDAPPSTAFWHEVMG